MPFVLHSTIILMLDYFQNTHLFFSNSKYFCSRAIVITVAFLIKKDILSTNNLSNIMGILK